MAGPDVTTPKMIHLDSTSFPVIDLAEAGLSALLLPVTKVQFEYFLGARTGFELTAFGEVYATGPRSSWRQIPGDRFEEVFLTGVLPDEAERFARWVGEGFRLPTEAEWRAADAGLAATTLSPGLLRDLTTDPTIHPAARAIVRWLLDREPARAWPCVSLFDGGLVEWVRLGGGDYGLHGRPRPDLLRVIHNPQVHDAIRFRSAQRHRGCGFRLVRPLYPARP